MSHWPASSLGRFQLPQWRREGRVDTAATLRALGRALRRLSALRALHLDLDFSVEATCQDGGRRESARLGKLGPQLHATAFAAAAL
jgi:hypothetical protein